MLFAHQFLATGSLLPTFFCVDIAVTAIAAWLLVCGWGHARHGILEAAIAWVWSLIAIIAGTGMLLGITGGFGPVGFALSHLATFAVALVWRRNHLRQDRNALVHLVRSAPATPLNERVIAWSLALILVTLCGIAMVAEPAVMDSLNYHLPRLAHWLQDGQVHMLGSSDERLDYISALPEVVMAWMIGPVKAGFRGSVLLQAIGGTMAIAATIGLARISGLSRTAALLAGSLLLGMANVVAQFTAAQTDLFTTGVFASAFYLWLTALRRNEISWPGVLGAGLALGAKGTVFYLAPSALVWIAWWLRQYRLSARQWGQTLFAGAAGVALFAGPGMWRNWQTYGDPRGPAHWIEKFHPHLPLASAKLEKLRLNIISAAVQNLDPQSQPAGLQSPARETGLALVTFLPQSDPYTFLGQDRRAGLNRLFQRESPDADAVSFGVIPILLFFAGTLIAGFYATREPARIILVWSAGILIFFLYFNVLHQWHPFSFRYYVLAAPWIAVVSAWGIEQLKGYWRPAVWTVVIAATLSVAWRITLWTHQGGIQTVIHPERTIGAKVVHDWRLWSQSLLPKESPLMLALPDDRPLAAFYRQETPRNVQFLSVNEDDPSTAEALVRGQKGWLIVPAAKLLGREGRVRAKTWLFDGDEFHPCSLAAYHALEAGEQPTPFFYRQRWAHHDHALQQELLVKMFGAGDLRLTIENPTSTASPFTWSTPLARGTETLPPKTTIELTLPVPTDAVAEVRLRFSNDFSAINEKPIIKLRP